MTDTNPNRRQVLKLGAALPAVAAAIPMLLSGRDARAQKMPQKQAQYQDTPKNGQRCDGCQFYIPGDGNVGKCQVVAGEVAAEGWCALYAPSS
jgi:anaerobic selenocysteine-containing dehydrogenase